MRPSPSSNGSYIPSTVLDDENLLSDLTGLLLAGLPATDEKNLYHTRINCVGLLSSDRKLSWGQLFWIGHYVRDTECNKWSLISPPFQHSKIKCRWPVLRSDSIYYVTY